MPISKDIRLRVGDVELRTALPLFVRGEDKTLQKPTEDSRYLEVVKWQPNDKYGKEDEYEKHERENGMGCYYTKKGEEYSIRYDESCFRHPESCYTLASYDYDKKEDFYSLRFCGDRPLDLDEKDFKDFIEVIRAAKDIINNQIKQSNDGETSY